MRAPSNMAARVALFATLGRSAFVALAIALTACGASAREKTIRATLTATDSARATFIAYDATRQGAIVAKAPDEATGKAELAAYRVKRLALEKLFADTYRAIATAALVNDDHSLTGLLHAALLLSQELKNAGVIQ